MKDQKAYWENKILNWEKSIYSQSQQDQLLLEKLALPFRSILKKRMVVAEKLLANQIKGKVIADLGCGSGIFLKNLLKYKPKKLLGVDIAPSAIKIASHQVQKLNLSRKLKFILADLRKERSFLKNVDVVSGIGFIDYLNPQELQSIFSDLKGKEFLFSFPERIFSLREVLHRIYLILADCPGSYKYSKKEMNNLLKKTGFEQWWYYEKENIRFVTNLPPNKNAKSPFFKN